MSIDIENYFRDTSCVRIETSEEHLLIRKHEDGEVTVSYKEKFATVPGGWDKPFLPRAKEYTLTLGTESTDTDMYFRFQSPKNEELRKELVYEMRRKAQDLAEEFKKTAIRLLGSEKHSYVDASDLKRVMEARMGHEMERIIAEVLRLRGL